MPSPPEPNARIPTLFQAKFPATFFKFTTAPWFSIQKFPLEWVYKIYVPIGTKGCKAKD
jgi:hypothetical protein